MGLFSKVKNGLKKVGKAIRSGVNQVVDLVKEGVNRIFGIGDFIANLFGIQLPKKLRLRVWILKDETGAPLTTESAVQPVIDRATAIFKDELNTKIVGARGKVIDQVVEIPPTAALEPGCGGEAWKDEFGDAGHFYFLNTVSNPASFLTGYATPITAFIVRNVRGEKGCSLGPSTNYVTLDLAALPTISVGSSGDDVSASIGQIWLAHEIGHACGLWHVKKKINLMHKSEESGVNLRKWQKAIARNSRHISFL